MDMHLTDRVVMVTGGGSGIGRACVEALTAEGAKVLIVERNTEGEEAAAQLRAAGHHVEFVQTDVSNEADVELALKTIERIFGRLDSVIACAGVSGPVGTNATQVSVEAWDHVMAVNVRGNFLIAKHSVGLLSKSPEPSMVLLGSDSALVAFKDRPVTAGRFHRLKPAVDPSRSGCTSCRLRGLSGQRACQRNNLGGRFWLHGTVSDARAGFQLTDNRPRSAADHLYQQEEHSIGNLRLPAFPN
ncbi:SDR family NAD(P)-dependent oxidoreductase [Paenarthrobacter sp. 2TAF44]|uniref:SDR family NAD(P)-dependent oxidoreductase n=1 Tax=Paenarthrobacter sp. 2TAF44 TaxID=3233018 RepID=UPI003F98F52C